MAHTSNTVQKLKKGDVLTVLGRRWFQSLYGNTYFSASISINGETVHKIDFEYGYGDHYLDQSFKALVKLGYIDNESKEYYNEAAWRYCDRKGIKLQSSVSDVTRKKDLKF